MFYSKTKLFTWNIQYQPYELSYTDSTYSNISDDKRRWKSTDLTGAGIRHGETGNEWRGIDITSKGRHWFVPPTELDKLDAQGKIYWPQKENGMPRLKQYFDEMSGIPLQDIWSDIPPISSQAAERLGFPTQKPVALMERIISASSNKGDLVADFFCGCGTTIAAAQNLNRQWLGSDISHLAIKLITQRLIDHHGEEIKNTFEIDGFPRDIDSARELAEGVKAGRLKFEEWVVEVMLFGILNERRNTLGFDGHFTFDMNGKKQVGLIEVKSGKASPTQVNHFIQTVGDKQAQMGVFVCFRNEVTNNMLTAAKKQGKLENFGYDKIQILTIEDLLEGKLPNRPVSRIETFKQAERKKTGQGKQGKLDLN